MIPYSVSSDQHLHGWSAFSQTNDDGVNSRLATILSELKRQARTLVAAGGKDMFLGGDLYHVRGKIDPEVQNPAIDTFREICGMGVRVWAIAGNHDLTGKHSDKLGNAMQALDELDGFTAITDFRVVTADGGQEVVMIPWVEDLDDLRSIAINNAGSTRDLIIHAPLNGVIKGLPDHGLDPVEVKQWGYRRVFVGHYHHHNEQAKDVYSIGASSHQTWSDPGTNAGFLMVGDKVEFHESLAPQFVNIDDVDEIDPVSVSGNYVRLRLKDADADLLAKAREALKDAGALNWVDHSTKKREVTRGSSSTKNVTLEVSVASYVANHLDAGKLSKKRIAVEALDVLREARTLGSE
jgi:hypothetical protein